MFRPDLENTVEEDLRELNGSILMGRDLSPHEHAASRLRPPNNILGAIELVSNGDGKVSLS